MRALVKDTAGPGLSFTEVPEPQVRPDGREDPGAACGAVRHRPAPRAVGRLGRLDRAAAPDRRRTSSSARSSRSARTSPPSRSANAPPARGTSSAASAATAGPGGGRCASAPRGSASTATGRSPTSSSSRPPTCGCSPTTSTPTSAPSSTRSATPPTRPCRSRWSVRTCSSPAPARSGSWPPRSPGTSGRATSWSPTCRDYRLELAKAAGADLVVNVSAATASPRPSGELGMREGFDIGLEMSGNPAAVDDMIANMNHGGRVAMLGLPKDPYADRLGPGHHPHDHHQGHLRPGDVRHLVRDVARCSRPRRCCMDARRARSSPTASRPSSGRTPSPRPVRASAARSSSTGAEPPITAVPEPKENHDVRRSRRARRHAAGDPRTPGSEARARADLAAVGPHHDHPGRGAELLRQQLPGAGRPPRRRRGGGEGVAGVGFRHGQRALHLRHADAAHPAGGADRRVPRHRGAILYSSCFDANGGVFEVLFGAEDAIVSDELNHAVAHRRHPAVQGRAVPLQERRHGRPAHPARGGAGSGRPADGRRHRRRVLDGRLVRPARRDLRPRRRVRRDGPRRRLARRGLRR